jgi:hypothetical protein
MDDGSTKVVSATLAEPWATPLAEEFQADMIHNTTNPDHDLSGRGSYMMTLVPPAGDAADAVLAPTGPCVVRAPYRLP